LKILHICSDFAKQSIYNQLIAHLSNDKSINQFVFVPCRSIEEIGKNQNLNLNNVEYLYSKIYNKLDRIFFNRKIYKATKILMNAKSKVDILHAHFLFSDGAIALEFFYKFKTPYIVAVRNTDLNYFFKYMVHLRAKGIEILMNASKIIFLSDVYKSKLLEKYIPKKYKRTIESKSLVIPNGVDPFWLSNINQVQKSFKDEIKVVYIGDFSKNKNIQNTILALNLMRKKGHNIKFSIVGGGGNYNDQILKLIDVNTTWITYTKRTSDKEKIKSILQDSHIFCMPSKYETFGIVYIEAMTQGLPLIFTKNQGIDGYFQDGQIGYAVRNNNINDIIKSILNILDNYEFMSGNCLIYSKSFSWDKISNKYLEIYKTI
jgi:glycosyltransferase involved in cell wall biosynthesis